jgi:predicted MPP superfamily phosphohydrolase
MLELPRLTRRRFLATAAGSAGLLGAYAWRIEPHWLHVVHRDLPIARLPPALNGRTLVQISDLHVGPVVATEYLVAAMRRVSALHPDLTVITGDFMTCEGSEQVAHVGQVLEHLAPGPLGCVAILGNHDYGRRASRPDVAEQLTRRLQDLGVRVLQNQACTISGLQFIGLDDLWSRCFDPETAWTSVRPEQPSLVLCHNPDAADLPVWSGYRGWILAGHTHGGQCKIPFLPPPLLPVKNPRYTAGALDLGDGRRMYINPGLGYLRRVRFNVRPEITAFRLRPA